jgi:hypothetical protein
MPLMPEEQAELQAIEQELAARQSPHQSAPQGLTQEEQNELMAIEQELAARQSRPVSINMASEADLGFINRARYSIEPLESNRRAFLAEQYGQENVMQDNC